MNVSIPEIADLLIERTQNSSWVVSFKALITIHHLMSFGNEVDSSFFPGRILGKLIVCSDLKRIWHRIIIICNR